MYFIDVDGGMKWKAGDSGIVANCATTPLNDKQATSKSSSEPPSASTASFNAAFASSNLKKTGKRGVPSSTQAQTHQQRC